MKKLLAIICVLAGSFVIQPGALFAQIMSDSTMTTAGPDEKTQKKIDQAKEQLAKDQEQLAKESAKYEKAMAKFQKDKKKGKLSPDKEAKAQKELDKTSEAMGKLKSRIAENESILANYKQ